MFRRTRIVLYFENFGPFVSGNHNVQNVLVKIFGFTLAKNKHWKPAAELVFEEDALISWRYMLNCATKSPNHNIGDNPVFRKVKV